MFRWLTLLLLLCCFISYSGTSSRSVSGKKGGNVILSCDFEDRQISHIVLSSQTEIIDVCQTEGCSGRVFKEGSCDIIIKDLRLRDAGKYFLRVYYTNDQTELKRQILEYHLHIQDEISVNISEELKLDVLLTNAFKVEHQNMISTEWKEVWTRESNSSVNVTDERLDVRDGNLTILHFEATDAGTYRVLDSEGEILITVTLTESNKDSAGECKDDPKNKSLIIGLSVCGVLFLVAVVVSIYFIWKSQCQNRNADHEAYRDVPMQEVGVSGAQPNTCQDDET